jgi:DNA invertase Pin-like site-specific DNA recombinase
MAEDRFVVYYRVSPRRQVGSGLNLEAQQQAVREFLSGHPGKLVGEFTEFESRANRAWPALAEALDACRLHGATLVIPRLHRLSRYAQFLFALHKAGVSFRAVDTPHATEMPVGMLAVMAARGDRKSISTRRAALAAAKAGGVEQPENLDKVGEDRRKANATRTRGERTRAGLAAARARGVKLGGRPENLKNTVEGRQKANAARARMADDRAMLIFREIRSIRLRSGISSASGIAKALNERGVPAPRGGKWQAVQVQRVLARDKRLSAERQSLLGLPAGWRPRWEKKSDPAAGT